MAQYPYEPPPGQGGPRGGGTPGPYSPGAAGRQTYGADYAPVRKRLLPFGFDQTPASGSGRFDRPNEPGDPRPIGQPVPPLNPYYSIPGFEHFYVAGTGGSDAYPFRDPLNARKKIPSRERAQQISDAARALAGQSITAPSAGMGPGAPLATDPDWLRRYRRGLNP